MFHYRDNLFFGRLPNGSVRIIKFARPPEESPKVDGTSYAMTAMLDVTVDADSWCSVIATVSNSGEEFGRFSLARQFHNG